MKTIKLSILALLSVLALIACQKKDDGAGAQSLQTINCYNGQIAPQGYTCIYNGGGIYDGGGYYGGGNLINNVQFQHDSIGLSGVLSLTANSGSSFMDFNDPRLPAKYFGNVTAQGSVNFTSNVTCNGVPLTGNYNLSGSQGMYSMGILSGFNWNLTSTVNGLNIQLVSSGSSVLYGDVNGLTRDGMNRIGLSVSVYVNNQYCGYIYTR